MHKPGCAWALPTCARPTQHCRCTSLLQANSTRGADRSPPKRHAGCAHHRLPCSPSCCSSRPGLGTFLSGARSVRASWRACCSHPPGWGEGALAVAHARSSLPAASVPLARTASNAAGGGALSDGGTNHPPCTALCADPPQELIATARIASAHLMRHVAFRGKDPLPPPHPPPPPLLPPPLPLLPPLPPLLGAPGASKCGSRLMVRTNSLLLPMCARSKRPASSWTLVQNRPLPVLPPPLRGQGVPRAQRRSLWNRRRPSVPCAMSLCTGL